MSNIFSVYTKKSCHSFYSRVEQNQENIENSLLANPGNETNANAPLDRYRFFSLDFELSFQETPWPNSFVTFLPRSFV